MSQRLKEVISNIYDVALMTVICAVAITIAINSINTNKKINQTPKTNNNTVSKELPDENLNGHSQNNPLFASKPSWSEDFNSTTKRSVNPNNWNVLVGPAQNSNKEQQYYTNNQENLIIKDGLLQIIATNSQQPDNYNYASARIESENKREFLYGRFDFVAKLPSGAGTWPAIWMLPGNDLYATKSPESNILRYKNGGEIDVIEAIGSKPNIIYGVAHTSSDLIKRKDGTGSHGSVLVPDSTTNFNKYSLLWTPDKLSYEVNGVEYYSYDRPKNSDYTTWPYDQPFYLILNLAMGGTWGGIDKKNFPNNGINNKALPATFAIDSIDYYPYVGQQ